MSRSPRRTAVEQVLRDLGPMTSAEIAAHLGWETSVASRSIMHARQEYPGQLFRVVRYKPVTGKWGADQPVYALGPGEDRPKPKVDRKKRQSVSSLRSRTKRRAEINAKQRAQRRSKPLSIWAGLLPAKHRRLMAVEAANTNSMAEAA